MAFRRKPLLSLPGSCKEGLLMNEQTSQSWSMFFAF